MADPRTGCVRSVTSTKVPTWRVWLFHDNGMKRSIAPMHQPPSKQSIVLYGLVASILQEGPWDGAGLEGAGWGNDGGLGAQGSQVCHLLVAVRPVARAWLLRLGVCLEPQGWWWGGGMEARQAHRRRPPPSIVRRITSPCTCHRPQCLSSCPSALGTCKGCLHPVFSLSLFLKKLCPRSPHLSFVHR